MSNTSTVRVSLQIDDKGVVRGFQDIGSESEKAGRKGKNAFDDMNNSANVTTNTLKKMGTALAGAFAVSKIIEFQERVIQAASALQEVSSKYTVVFSSQTEAVNAWAENLIDKYAMSTRESKKYLSSIQDLLVPMGMQAAAAANLSNEIVKLSGDLGSFNDLPTQQVLEDMQSALVGEYDTMKKYGVVLNAATVQQKALNMGLADTKDSLTAADKAQAAYKLIVESSTAAIGDMDRTSDGYANTTKRLGSEWEDFSATLGNKFLPVAAQIKGVTADILDNLTKALQGQSVDQQIAEIESKITNAEKQIASAQNVVTLSLKRQNSEVKSGAEEAAQRLKELREEGNRFSDYKPFDESVSSQKVLIDGLKEQLEILKQIKDASNIKDSWIVFSAGLKNANEQSAKFLSDQAAWTSEYERSIIKISSSTITAKETELARYRELENFKPEIVAAAEQEIAELRTKKSDEQLQALQDANQEKYKVEIALAEQVQEDTWVIRDKGLEAALEQHEETQTKITEMEYEEEQKRAEQAQRELEKRLKEEERLHEKLIETQQRAYESLFDKVQGYTAEIASDWGNKWDTMKDIAKRTVAELVSTFATQKIILPIVLSVGSAMGLSWQGTSFSDIANVAGYGSDSGFGITDLFSVGKSIFTMPSTSSAYYSLTSGTMGDVGEALFGTAWAGGAVPISTGALAAGAELGWGAAAMAEIGTGTGMGGIASALSAAAPFLSMAALAIPLIMSFFEDDPDPRVAVLSGRLENSGEYEGEINSPSGYNYHTWLQDVDNRKELGETITTYFDVKLDAIDAAFDFDLKEITKGHDFGEVIGNPVEQYDGDLEELLNVMSENLLGGLMPVLMQQLLPDETWETIGDTFNRDFLLEIQQDGEDLYETFIRFGAVVQGTEDFMSRYTEQVEDYDETAKTAIENLSGIMTAKAEIEAGLETITSVSAITTLQELTEAWYGLIDALKDAHAKTEEVTAAQSAMAQALGANITGLTADALQSALSQGGDVQAILEASITGSAYAYIAQTISDSYLAAINEEIGQVWIDTDGDIQAVIDAMRQIDTTEAQAELQGLIDMFGDLAEGTATASTTLDDQLTTAASNLEAALQNEISSKTNELTILQDNLDTARDNYLNALDAEIDKQKDARDAADDAARTFRDLAQSLAAGKLNILSEYGGDPSQSFALAKELYDAAVEGVWNKDTDAMAALPDLAAAYLDAGKSVLNAVELNDLVAAVYSQMSTAESIAKVEAAAQEEVVDAAQDQIDALEETRAEVASAGETLLSIDAAADDYYAASLALEESGLEREISTLEAQLAELQALNSNIISLSQARTDYNVAQVAVDEASGSYAFNESIYLQNKLNQLNSNAASADVQAANQKYGNTDGVWTMSELEAVFALEGLTAEDHYQRYGYGEGVSPYVAQSSGYADGGIASGPVTGYYELLHGTEAIIPLGKGALSLIIQGGSDDYGQQLVAEVVEFRETMDQHLLSMRTNLKSIAIKLEKWDRYGIPKERAA